MATTTSVSRPLGYVALADLLEKHRGRLAGTIEQSTARAMGELRIALRDREKSLPQVLESTAATLRRRLLADLMTDDSLRDLAALSSGEAPDRAALSSFISLAAPDLELKPSPPVLQIRPLAAVTFAAVGAVLGMLALTPLVRWLLGMPGEVGTLVGAPLGAGLSAAALYYLGRNPKLATGLLVAVGGVAAADLVFSVLDVVSPFANLRRLLTGGGSIALSLPRRLLIYGLLAVLLFIARSQRTSRVDESLAACEAVLRGWLNNACDLMVLAVLGSRGAVDAEETASSPSPQLLDALVTLRDDLERHQHQGADAAEVVTSAIAAVGTFEAEFETLSDTDSPTVFKEELRELFDTYGHVVEGMPVRVLKRPWLKEGRVMARGVLARRSS